MCSPSDFMRRIPGDDLRSKSRGPFARYSNRALLDPHSMAISARARVHESSAFPHARLSPALCGSVGTLPIVKSIFDFAHVHRPTWKRIRALSIWFIVLKFTNIFLSVGPHERTLPAL